MPHDEGPSLALLLISFTSFFPQRGSFAEQLENAFDAGAGIVFSEEDEEDEDVCDEGYEDQDGIVEKGDRSEPLLSSEARGLEAAACVSSRGSPPFAGLASNKSLPPAPQPMQCHLNNQPFEAETIRIPRVRRTESEWGHRDSSSTSAGSHSNCDRTGDRPMGRAVRHNSSSASSVTCVNTLRLIAEDWGGCNPQVQAWDGSGYTASPRKASQPPNPQGEPASPMLLGDSAGSGTQLPELGVSAADEGSAGDYPEDPGSSFLWYRLKQFLAGSRWFTTVTEVLRNNKWEGARTAISSGARSVCRSPGPACRASAQESETQESRPANDPEVEGQEEVTAGPAEAFYNLAQCTFYRSFLATPGKSNEDFVVSMREAMGGWIHWDHRLTRPLNAFFLAARAVSVALASSAGTVAGGAYRIQADVRSRVSAGKQKGRALALACGDVLARWDQVFPVARRALDKWMPAAGPKPMQIMQDLSDDEVFHVSTGPRGRAPRQRSEGSDVSDASLGSDASPRLFSFSPMLGQEADLQNNSEVEEEDSNEMPVRARQRSRETHRLSLPSTLLPRRESTHFRRPGGDTFAEVLEEEEVECEPFDWPLLPTGSGTKAAAARYVSSMSNFSVFQTADFQLMFFCSRVNLPGLCSASTQVDARRSAHPARRA